MEFPVQVARRRAKAVKAINKATDAGKIVKKAVEKSKRPAKTNQSRREEMQQLFQSDMSEKKQKKVVGVGKKSSFKSKSRKQTELKGGHIKRLVKNKFMGVHSASTFTLMNNCDYTVWPGILSNSGISPLNTTGFALQRGESKSISAPNSWGGRLWGRTHCTQDPTGAFSCITGDCGSGKIECSGSGAIPPATLAEFTLNGHDNMDFYDVSLVDGYNLPIGVVPQGGSGDKCSTIGCSADLNDACPPELELVSPGGERVACRSACEAFGEDKYCCRGAYGLPETCKPTEYSEVFKKACPTAYSYAYDDGSSTFTCSAAAGYLITFCPTPDSSQNYSGSSRLGPESGDRKFDPMRYDGIVEISSAISTFTVAHGGTMVATAWWLTSFHLI